MVSYTKSSIVIRYSQVNNCEMEWLESYPASANIQQKIQQFAQMIWAETDSVGCAKSLYGFYETIFFCLYFPAGRQVGKPAFKRGEPCSECPIKG